MRCYCKSRKLVLLAVVALAAEPLPLPLGPAAAQQLPPGAGTATLSPGSTTYSSGSPAVPPDLPSGQPPYAVGVVTPGLLGPYPGGMPAGVMATPMPAAQGPPPAPEPTLPPPRVDPGVPAAPTLPGGIPPQTAPPPETAFRTPGSSLPAQAPLPVSMNLEELRQEITRLQSERRALSAARATLADSLPALPCKSPQENPCTEAMQERIRSLMEQARRQAREPRESEPAALPRYAPQQAPVDSPGKPVKPPPPKAIHPAESAPPAAPSSPKTSTPSAEKPVAAKQERPTLPSSVDIRVDAPIEPLGLAQALFQAGDYKGALKAYRILEQGSPSAESLVSIQYMMASCLRKLGQLDEAAALYREVATSDADDLLAETAQWHLNTLKARRELEGQLDQLRQRRRSLTEKKP